MKKTYQAPEMKTVVIKPSCLIAASQPQVGFGNGTLTNSNDVGSRRGGDFWDDEEEDY